MNVMWHHQIVRLLNNIRKLIIILLYTHCKNSIKKFVYSVNIRKTQKNIHIDGQSVTKKEKKILWLHEGEHKA